MKKVLSLLLVASSILPMQLDMVKNVVKKTRIKSESFFTPSNLGSVKLYHNKKGFHVKQDNEKHIIKKYFTDPVVRDITKKQLKTFLEAGYFSLNRMDDGEFSLKAKGRINGGGPILGTIAYWVTKSACYAVGFAAIGTTVVTTGGAAVGLATYGAATAGGMALGATAVSTTAAATIGTTAGAVAGTAAVGASIATGAGVAGGAVGVLSATGATVAGMSAGAAAATTTAAAVTATGSIAATIAGVESVSLAVGTFFGMLPTP